MLMRLKIIAFRNNDSGNVSIDSLPYYAVRLPYSSSRIALFEELGLHQLKDPSTNEGMLRIGALVDVLMTNDSAINYRIDCILLRLVHAEEWDHWVIDSVMKALSQVIKQSVQDIVESKDTVKVRGAVERLYKLAYLDKRPSHYENQAKYYSFERTMSLGYGISGPSNLAEIHQRIMNNYYRLREVHNMMMEYIDEVLLEKSEVTEKGVAELARLREVFVKKNELKNYLYHRTKEGRIFGEDGQGGIKAHGLNVAYTDSKHDERPDYIFFWDWGRFDGYFQSDGLVLRVRIGDEIDGLTENTMHASWSYQEFSDLACHFRARRIPVELIEVVDPFEPWKAYPLKDLTPEIFERILQTRTLP